VSPVSPASEAALSFPPAARPQATFRSTLQLRQEPSLGWRLRGVRPEVRPPSAWSWSLRGNALFCGPPGQPRFDHSPAPAALVVRVFKDPASGRLGTAAHLNHGSVVEIEGRPREP
jgi:hypothetical protein